LGSNPVDSVWGIASNETGRVLAGPGCQMVLIINVWMKLNPTFRSSGRAIISVPDVF
jgi:hypothetical protein